MFKWMNELIELVTLRIELKQYKTGIPVLAKKLTKLFLPTVTFYFIFSSILIFTTFLLATYFFISIWLGWSDQLSTRS